MKKLLVFLLFAGVISFIPSSLHPLFSSSLIAQIPADGLVAWYPFNGNANDESGNNHHGSITGGTFVNGRNGNASGAIQFTSSATGFVDANIGSNYTQNFTVSMWVKADRTSTFVNESSTCPGGVSVPMANSNQNWALIPPNYGSNLGAGIAVNQNGIIVAEHANNVLVSRLSRSISSTAFNHVVIVYRTDSTFLYLNGSLVRSRVMYCPSNSKNTGSNLRFGGSLYSPNFAGSIDDVGIWSRALTRQEVQLIYSDQTGQVQQPFTCSITAPITSICSGESVTLSINTTGGAGSSSQLPANLQQGLVAYYPFNGNANDESGNGNDGTVNGATLTADRFGNANGAYGFDGVNDYISVERSPFNEFTISFWTKLDAFNCYGAFIDSYDSNWEFLTDCPSNSGSSQGTGNIEFVPWSGTGYSELPVGYVIPLNQWKNLVLSYQSNIVSVYVNGVLINQLSNINFNFTSGVYNFGASLSGSDQYLNGKMDDIAVYNRALSTSEIQQLYTTQSYAWNTGAATSSITVTPTADTTYSCTVTQGNSTCTASVDITVNPVVTNAISASIVEGQSYTLGTQTLTTAGTYTEVFTSGAGCDSTVTLTLTVEPLLTCNITAPVTSICEGESVTLSINTTGGAGSSSQLPANLQEGLVAYYPFNGNANDESGNGNNGTVNGATLTADRFGSSGSAYSFDGMNDFISVGNNASLELNNFSIALWSNLEESSNWTSGANGGGFFVHKGCDNSTFFPYNGFSYRIYYQNPFGLITDHFTSNRVVLENNDAELFQNWNSVVFTFDNSYLKLFFNGVVIDSIASFGITAVNNESLLFGCRKELINGICTFDDFFTGKLDDIFIYNRALSTSEIQQLYTTQSYAWNTGATTSSITVTPTMDTTYSCTVTQGNSTCTASVDITVNPAVSNAISASIVEGQSYTLGTQTLTTAGTYTEVFTSAAGCDSTVTLTLSVEPLLTCNITAPVTTICAGESVTLSVNTTAGSGSSSQLPANLQQGLVAYYPFNGNANDESGNGNNGTVNGATLTADRFGNGNSAFSFDDSFIEAPLDANLVDFSISLWIRTATTRRQIPIIRLLYDDAGSEQFGIALSDLIANNLELAVKSNNPNCTRGIGWNKLNSDVVYFDNVYHHVLATCQNNVLRLNFDGNEIGQYVMNSPMSACNQGNIQIGRNWANDIAYYLGDLDDIYIYNRALSPSEIQQLYTAQSFAWNTGATNNAITVSPTTDTTYSCTVTQGNSTCTASVDIIVNPSVNNTISASIVEGQSFTLGTQTLTTAGTYTEVFTSAAGCDSTVTLTLSVEPLLTCEIIAPTTSLCEGESVMLSVNTTGGAGASSQLPANLQDGLVAYYPFNGNANDESGNGNDGTVNGATLTSDRFGNASSAYFFNGINSHIDVNSIYEYGDFSIVFWEKINDLKFSYPIGLGINTTTYNNGFGIGQSGITGECELADNIHFVFDGETGCGAAMYSSIQSDFQQWRLVSFTFESGISKLYYNGSLVSESNALDFPGFFSLSFGVRSDYLFPFDGLMDDIMVFNRAISFFEVQQILTEQLTDVVWSNGSSTPTITAAPTEATIYTATVFTATQTCTDSIAITVNPALTWYADADGDGFGSLNAVVLDCNQPAGYVMDNTDCNDAVASAFPGGEDICDNNIDEDCNGQDSICFAAVLGCTNANACNFNPLANTDDNSCILPQPEVCDGLDNNCNNQIDEGFTIPTINPVAVTPALYPTCTGNALKSADFNAGTNSPIIDGNGPDLWYSFTAQFNTLRVGLSAAFGDNSIGLYTLNNGCLELITEEHEVYTATTLATGNQILLSDQLTVGQTYYVAVHQITGPTNASAKVCFTYLNGSGCDHYYSNNTGLYTSVCNSFKAQYRANATNYIFNVLSGTQNGVNMNLTPWSYTNNNANSVVARLGSILPANHSGANRVYTLAVPVVYGLTDAAGNVSNLLANATTTCTVTLNSEATIALRQADRCPAAKSITGTIAPDRSVCGAMRYDWEFTEVLPNPGTAQVVQGGAYASVFFLSNVPGVAAGKTYNVRVRPVHTSGNAGSWGAVNCLRIGNAGMVLDNHPVQTAQALDRTPLLSLRAGGEMNASYSIYPNPTTTGSFVLQYNGSRRGESIFAQEPTTTESTIAQEQTSTESTIAQETTMESTQELKMMDITGKVVYQQQVVLNGNAVEIQFGKLASGVYVVMVGEERMRLIIE